MCPLSTVIEMRYTKTKLRIDPGNNLGVTAPFNLNAGPGAEPYVGSTVTGIDDERGTGSIDWGRIN